MTYKERLKAFELRMQGNPWGEIAKAIGYSPATVERDLKSIVNGKKYKCICIYPRISEVLNRDYNGSTQAFAEACGVSYGSMYECLSGKAHSPKVVARICEFMDLSPNQAFRKDERI